MKIREDEVLRPMQYDRFVRSVKKRGVNDVDSGIDYWHIVKCSHKAIDVLVLLLLFIVKHVYTHIYISII